VGLSRAGIHVAKMKNTAACALGAVAKNASERVLCCTGAAGTAGSPPRSVVDESWYVRSMRQQGAEGSLLRQFEPTL